MAANESLLNHLKKFADTQTPRLFTQKKKKKKNFRPATLVNKQTNKQTKPKFQGQDNDSIVLTDLERELTTRLVRGSC
jgi:hypothetical protein